MKIFLSGIESAPHALHAAASIRLPNVLTSYHYAIKSFGMPARAAMLTRVLAQAKCRIIDSGAFSFLYGAGDRSIDFDQYLTDYLEWSGRMVRMGLADLVIELDLSKILGYQWVHAQRDRMIGAGLGNKLITVWHSDADWAYWFDLLREAKRSGRSRYVAIEGHHDDREKLDYARFIAEAYRQDVRVHGFMLTRVEELERWPFYSVDSTSWIAPARWGNQVKLSRLGTGVTAQTHTHTRVPVGSYWNKYVPVLVNCAQIWIEFERRVTESWVARGVDWARLDS